MTPAERADAVVQAFSLIRQACGESFPELYLGYEFYGLTADGWPENPTEQQERNSNCGYAVTNIVMHVDEFHRGEFSHDELVALFEWKARKERLPVNQDAAEEELGVEE